MPDTPFEQDAALEYLNFFQETGKLIKQLKHAHSQPEYVPEVHDLNEDNDLLLYPSVYAYFHTLPDYIQEKEEVIDAARVIDKYGIYLDNF